MFNHQQGHGMINPQMMQMQRLMASRPQRSAFMAADPQMNTPAELSDRRFQQMNWAAHQPQPQRNFGLVGQQPPNLLAFPTGRADFNQHFGASMGQMAANGGIPGGSAMQMGGSSGGSFIGSASMRMPVFKCPDGHCGIVKNSSEELEIHLKTEHLNWLPFVCPLCSAGRASDIQMREHMHSFHKKNENKYFYHDNPQAKKVLQEMMDKALFGASTQFQQMKRRSAVFQNGTMQAEKKARLMDDEEKARKLEDGGKSQNGGPADKSSHSGRRQSLDDAEDAQLASMFGSNVKSEFDMAVLEGYGNANGTPSPHQNMLLPNEEDDLPDDNSHQLDALQSVAAMFSASGGSERFGGLSAGRNDGSGNRFFRKKRIVRNRPGPMTSKRRVLGECSKCHKPITTGARQMHMFFHLGKDMNTYRFRCKHAGCDVEHYRKDQMENHQSKVHGRVDPNMMDDRSQELYNLVQKMSLELLGTTGNTPGPTAAKAQAMYDQQMRELHANMGNRRRTINRQPYSPSGPMSSHNALAGGVGANNRFMDAANRRVEDLECRLCHKKIMSRIRGFHILWHLNNDLGIVRYGCKFCNFKHDRPQSVVAHGTREHGTEDACEDLLYNFEDELKSMSKACFGVERLFEKEIRRRSKMERDGGAESPELEEEDEDSQLGSSSAMIGNLKVPLKPDSSDRSWANWASKDPVKKRRSLRRFGTRAKSKSQKEKMIKLREVSMRLGGAQYFKKKTNEAVPCAQCGKMVTNRLSDHAYSHLEGCDLFRCQKCNLGHYSRENIVRHLRDFHNTNNVPPLDNRLRFAQEIKDAIRECYPRLFIDAPIPTKEDIEKLKKNLKLKNMVVSDKDEDDQLGDASDDGKEEEEDDEEEQGKEEDEEDDEEEDAATAENEESGLNEDDEGEQEGDEELMDEEEEHEDEEEDPDYDEEEEEEGGQEEQLEEADEDEPANNNEQQVEKEEAKEEEASSAAGVEKKEEEEK